MKVMVKDCQWYFIRTYLQCNDSKVDVRILIAGLEMDLLKVVLQQVKMMFVHVRTPAAFEMGKILTDNSFKALSGKEVYTD